MVGAGARAIEHQLADCHVSRLHLESIRKIQFDGENIRDFVGAVSIKGGKWNPDRVDGVGMG